MKCPKCGYESDNINSYCPKCGNRISEYPSNDELLNIYKNVKIDFDQDTDIPKWKQIIRWVFCGLFALFGFIFFPSISSLLFFIVAAIFVPYNKVKNAIDSIIPKGKAKAAIVTLLALIGIAGVPKTEPAVSAEVIPTPTTAIERSLDETANSENDLLNAALIEASPEITAAVATPEVTAEPTPIVPKDSYFKIYFLDVGEGDCSVIICDDEAMIIDGGSASKSDLVYSFLRKNEISHLKYMVCTHPDEDHVGGLSGALNYANVDKVYCTVKEADSKPFEDFLKYLGEQELEISIPNVGEQLELGNATITFLSPEANQITNDNTSIVLKIEYGLTSALFTGDAESAQENALIANNFIDLQSTLLKVAHHGSNTSTSEEFVKSVSPQYAVISVGDDNSYAHPTEEVLNTLKAKNVKMYRTDMQGEIVCTSNGEELHFNLEKKIPESTFDVIGPYSVYLEEEQARVAEEAKAAEEAEAQRALLAQQDEEEAAKAIPGTDYVLNPSSMKFHYPHCSSAKRMKESNKVYFNGTRDELIAKGYSPCGNCNP